MATVNVLYLCIFSVLTLVISDNDVIPSPPTITDFLIESGISSRFAEVRIQARVDNAEKEGREAMFQVQFPVSAFISGFKMTIGNEVRYGVVKEKQEANDIYDQAKEDGKSAGQIKQRPKAPGRDMDSFVVNINVAALSSTVFELLYRELIEMRLGRHTQKIHISPGQIVANLSVKAVIYEPQGILDCYYVLPHTNESRSSSYQAARYRAALTSRTVLYQPSSEEQRTAQQSGISGDLIISYVTERDDTGGLILINDGFFAHYFSPSGLEVIPKNILFIIDISGSMGGFKMKKVREVMMVILDQLRPDDYFGLLLFDHNTEKMKSEPIRASTENIKYSKNYASEKLIARGSTDINMALLEGLSILDRTKNIGGANSNIIVFLTDGQPTSGVTNKQRIRRNVLEKNGGKTSIYALGFGNFFDFEFLSALAWENGGFARRIYEEKDAAEQLETFYNEVESPLLLKVNVTYEPRDKVSALTQTKFSQYRKGSELVIAGKIEDGIDLSGFMSRVEGIGRNDVMKYEVKSSVIPVDFTEQLWAYLQIKNLLKDLAVTTNTEKQRHVKSKALNLSLEYQFVTPLTAMVVTSDMQSRDMDYGNSMLESAVFHDLMLVRRSGKSKVFSSSAYGNTATSITVNMIMFIVFPVSVCL